MKFLVFKKLKTVVTHICNQLGLVKMSTNGRPSKISKIEAITLSLYKNQSTRATKKSIYEDFKNQLKCSYKTLVVSMNASATTIVRILFWLMRQNKKTQSLVKFTDATDIPVRMKRVVLRHQTDDYEGFSREIARYSVHASQRKRPAYLPEVKPRHQRHYRA